MGRSPPRERIRARGSRSIRHGRAEGQSWRPREAALLPHRGGGEVCRRGPRPCGRREATAGVEASEDGRHRRARHACRLTRHGSGRTRRSLRRRRVRTWWRDTSLHAPLTASRRA